MAWQNSLDDRPSLLQELNSPTLSTYTHSPKLPIGDSRSQIQDTSGLEMFLPPPGVSRGVEMQPTISSRDPALDLGSSGAFNFANLPYGSNFNGDFDFNFAFDPNLLDFNHNNDGARDLMLPNIPNSLSGAEPPVSSAPVSTSVTMESASDNATNTAASKRPVSIASGSLGTTAPARLAPSIAPTSAPSTSGTLGSRPFADIDNTAWATRNPGRAVIAPRPPPTRLTEAQKASRAIVCEQKKTERDALDEDIKRFLSIQEDEIAKIAMAHNVKVEKIRDLLGFNNYYKKHRKPTLHNAILHFKATETNQGAPAHAYSQTIDKYYRLANRSSPWTKDETCGAQSSCRRRRQRQKPIERAGGGAHQQTPRAS
jgi:hypothetical protein